MLRPRTGPTVVLVRAGTDVASWPLSAERIDMTLVDRLARLQLRARSLGCAIRLRNACVELKELLELAGLDEVIAADE